MLSHFTHNSMFQDVVTIALDPNYIYTCNEIKAILLYHIIDIHGSSPMSDSVIVVNFVVIA